MAQQTIGIGTSANDGTGDALRTAFTKVNENFTEVYTSLNPSVIALSATDGSTVTGTLTETLSRSLLIPANTFSSNGILEAFTSVVKTGVAGNLVMRIYKNTSNTLTGATLIGTLANSGFLFGQGIRTFRINSNTITYFVASQALISDYTSSGFAMGSTTFTTNVDNYIIFSLQLTYAGDSAKTTMARLTKSI